jgi:hypothetical protein
MAGKKKGGFKVKGTSMHEKHTRKPKHGRRKRSTKKSKK